MQCEYDADIDARLDICPEHGVFIHHDHTWSCPTCHSVHEESMAYYDWLYLRAHVNMVSVGRGD